jgi:uncharacterized protein (TIGR01777 family)
MRILVTGATGLIGTEFFAVAKQAGHDVAALSRNVSKEHHWSLDSGISEKLLRDAHVVLHLAGENIGKRRWSDEQKRSIIESRRTGTHAVAESIALNGRHLKAFVCASAVGFYGNKGDEILTEDALPSAGFLHETCTEWENAAEPAKQAGVRVVHARFGVVLNAHEGMLGRLIPVFRWCLGAKIADGRQWISWISSRDVARALLFLIENSDLQGPVNVCSPHPVTNHEFGRTLAALLRRPCWFTIPGFVIELFYGQMGTELLLWSQRAVPKKLLDAGFEFELPELRDALRYELRVRA